MVLRKFFFPWASFQIYARRRHRKVSYIGAWKRLDAVIYRIHIKSGHVIKDFNYQLEEIIVVKEKYFIKMSLFVENKEEEKQEMLFTTFTRLKEEVSLLNLLN